MGLLSRIRALAPSLLLTAVLAVGFTAWLPPAPAAAAVCSGSTGVSVVVQFPDNHIETGCAPGDPSSGLDALTKAGFRYEFVPQQPGAVCRIDGAPASGPCWQPPDSWSYWYAERGGSWTFSNLGAGNRNPKPGTVEGWVFGTKDKPGMAPPAAVPPPTSQPKPTEKPTKKPQPTKKPTPTKKPKPTKPAASAPVGAPTASPSVTQGATPSATPTQGSTASADPTAASSTGSEAAAGAEPSESPSSGPSTTGDLVGASAPVADDTDSSGGLSWGWGVGLVGVLAVAGAVAAIARRRA